VLAGLVGVGGCRGFKSGLERVMVLVKHGAWFLRVACFRTACCFACVCVTTASSVACFRWFRVERGWRD
jgi:hypothetical protein